MSVNPPVRVGRRLPRRPQLFDPNDTTAIFENPATGRREGIPSEAWVYMLIFGGFYMVVRGLWRPLAIMLLVLIGASIFFWPSLLFVAPATWLYCSAKAQDIMRDHYDRLGWDEIDPKRQEDEHAA